MDTEQRDICEVLGQLGVFRSLAYGHLRDVVEIGCIRDYRTGKSLYYQGDLADWAYLIVSGAVRRVKYRVDDTSLSLADAGLGDWIGLAELILNAPYLNDATARGHTRALAFSAAAFDRLIEVPGMRGLLMAKMARTIVSLHGRIELNAVLPRLVQHLLVHARDEGNGAGFVVGTQDEIAEAIGATRETVNKYLQRLQTQGLIALSRGRIDIPDLQALRDRLD